MRILTDINEPYSNITQLVKDADLYATDEINFRCADGSVKKKKKSEQKHLVEQKVLGKGKSSLLLLNPKGLLCIALAFTLGGYVLTWISQLQGGSESFTAPLCYGGKLLMPFGVAFAAYVSWCAQRRVERAEYKVSVIDIWESYFAKGNNAGQTGKTGSSLADRFELRKSLREIIGYNNTVKWAMNGVAIINTLVTALVLI